eukprot:CAMPEP_0204603000 /NCGR_PEP_ID=MMETSP0661-20131031/56999_1 /ASSEMBLY_ACC=CAM_ASM_000606 /TAXON_ID=109239 /ORGANISM="Alexandrium margalefi, Strain AMGDE01CS-322" /LENGTH=329 /DNA_ID=CAMNT_0051614023 /DNA_START=200 /DNA_END=1188 /DNA_ORIENTATION=-
MMCPVTDPLGDKCRIKISSEYLMGKNERPEIGRSVVEQLAECMAQHAGQQRPTTSVHLSWTLAMVLVKEAETKRRPFGCWKSLFLRIAAHDDVDDVAMADTIVLKEEMASKSGAAKDDVPVNSQAVATDGAFDEAPPASELLLQRALEVQDRVVRRDGHRDRAAGRQPPVCGGLAGACPLVLPPPVWALGEQQLHRVDVMPPVGRQRFDVERSNVGRQPASGPQRCRAGLLQCVVGHDQLRHAPGGPRARVGVRVQPLCKGAEAALTAPKLARGATPRTWWGLRGRPPAAAPRTAAGAAKAHRSVARAAPGDRNAAIGRSSVPPPDGPA